MRFLLIGCGAIAQHAHLPAFQNHPDRLRLGAVCDPSDTGRRSVLQNLPDANQIHAFSDHREALNACGESVDAALITTPHFLHFEQARDCLKAGLPVLVEKPAAMNLAEARELLRLSRESGKPVVAGQNRRFLPEAVWLREWMRRSPENFGQLRSFDLRAWQNVEAWIATKPGHHGSFWALDKERSGGGVVLGLLIHNLDLLRYLSGHDFVEVNARGRLDPPFRNGAESACSGLLTLANGASGTFHANYLARKFPQPGEGLNLIGDHGFIGLGDGWKYGSTDGGQPDGWDWQHAGIAEVPADARSNNLSDSFSAQLLAFAATLKAGRAPANSLKDNFNTLAVIEAIYESMSRDGQPVKVEDIDNGS